MDNEELVTHGPQTILRTGTEAPVYTHVTGQNPILVGFAREIRDVLAGDTLGRTTLGVDAGEVRDALGSDGVQLAEDLRASIGSHPGGWQGLLMGLEHRSVTRLLQQWSDVGPRLAQAGLPVEDLRASVGLWISKWPAEDYSQLLQYQRVYQACHPSAVQAMLADQEALDACAG